MPDIKIVVVGDGVAGKTALIMAFCNENFAIGRFTHVPYPNLFDQEVVDVVMNGMTITATFFDTPGQEQYDRLRPLAYPETDAFIIVFAITRYASFSNVLDKWIPEIYHYCPAAQLFLVGTHSDLVRGKTVVADKYSCHDEIPVDRLLIDNLCAKTGMTYHETSPVTGKGVQECLMFVVEATFYHNYWSKYKIEYPLSTSVQDSLLRKFLVDKILDANLTEWLSFCVHLGYNKKAIKMQRSKEVNNQFWQVLQHWTAEIEQLSINPFQLLYQGLKKIRRIDLAHDLLEWIMQDIRGVDRKDVVDHLKSKPSANNLRVLKEHLSNFKYSGQEQIPPIIWKMGKNASELYIGILKSGVERKYAIRIPIVGPFGVGKTCLLRRLLKKEIHDVESTDGINIMALRCKVRIKDRKWIFSKECGFDVDLEKKKQLLKNMLSTDTALKSNKTRSTEMTDEDYHNSYSAESSSLSSVLPDTKQTTEHDIREQSNSTEKSGQVSKKEPDLMENDDTKKNYETKLFKPADVSFHERENFLKDIYGLDERNVSLDDFAEVMFLDFAGQYEFYATHQIFLNKHSIYMLAVDVSKNLKGVQMSEKFDECLEDMSEVPFEDIGEYINFWVDAIHCYGDNNPESSQGNSNLPSIIVVGTCKDKINVSSEVRREEIQEQLDTILGDHPKRNHIKDIVIISNVNSSESEFDDLRDKIVKLASNIETWGQFLPVRWIKLEQYLQEMKNQNDKLISHDELVELGKSKGLSIDNSEIELFLKYQHEIGNIIYFEDIPDFIILQPTWLVDALKRIITARKFYKKRGLSYNKDWKDLELTGRLSDELFLEIFRGVDRDTDVLTNKNFFMKVMDKLDIIVKLNTRNLADQTKDETSSEADNFPMNCISEKDENTAENKNAACGNGAVKSTTSSDPDTCEEHPTSEEYEYYVPCLIKSEQISNIVEHFRVQGKECRRTAWMCMCFEFLPPAFFNHILVCFLRCYQVSREPSTKANRLALYRGMGVFDLESNGCTKLAVCVYRNVIFFQIWHWRKIPVIAYKDIWEKAEATVATIQRRYKMKVAYTVKMKCPAGRHDSMNGMVNLSTLKKENEYFCDEHATSHKSEELLDSWFKGVLPIEKVNYGRIAKLLVDIVPGAMMVILEEDGINYSMTFSNFYQIFKEQKTLLPTSGEWGTSSFPDTNNVETGDDIEKCCFIIRELQAVPVLSSKRFEYLRHLLFGILTRFDSYTKTLNLVSQYHTVMSEHVEEERYELYVKKIMEELLENAFEVHLKRNMQRFKQEVEVAGILDDMLVQCVISLDDRRQVEHHVKHKDQIEQLVDVVIQRGRRAFDAFCKALHTNNYHELAESFKGDSGTKPKTPVSAVTSGHTFAVPIHRIRLQKNYVNIISNIIHESLVDQLISKDILSTDDGQMIDSCNSQRSKNRKLLEKIWYCNEEGFNEFLAALRSDDAYNDLADCVEKTNVTEDEANAFQYLF